MKQPQPISTIPPRDPGNIEDGAPLERQLPKSFRVGGVAVSQHPVPESIPVSKIRRHGSKLISVLRSFTNSTMSNSGAEFASANSSSQNLPSMGDRKYSIVLKGTLEPTIIHRTQFKSRPSIISLDIEKGIIDITPVESSASSPGSSTLSPISPTTTVSTQKTSVDSKFSAGKSANGSGNSSENAKASTKNEGSKENSLPPISESDVPVPTVTSVENAAAAKIFFECHYNNITSGMPTPRSIRRRKLEGNLYYNLELSTLEKENKRRAWAKQETQHLRETRMLKARVSNALKGADITSSRYEVVKVLGKGSFGVVRLVREKNDCETERNQIYAMKVIRKSDMLRNSQEGHLRAERDFLVAAEGSRWVVPLIASFQDLHSLYLIMDYMPGGDFLGLLIRDNILSESVTKWYIAEMILCIEEAHALRWIHRDVKPDNFLISASGHLKISDFGLAFDGHWSHDQAYYNNHRYSLLTKLGINVEGDTLDRKEGRNIANAAKATQAFLGGEEGKERHERKSSTGSDGEEILNWRNRNGNRTLARSVVGTSQYMAPEVVRGELYDARCDWWSVGIILYECLYGHTPFLSEEGGRQATKQNIVAHKTTFGFPHKPVISRRCQDLMRNIIQEKEQRLCSKRYKINDNSQSSRKINDNASSSRHIDYAGQYVYPNDAEEIKAHKWFKDIQWDKIHLSVPPFVPDIKSMEDTQYFDEEEPISDFSESSPGHSATSQEITDALKPFNRDVQMLAKSFIASPHDSLRLKKMEREIDGFMIADEQKEYLKAFVKHYGQKEKKRPRDKLLRDKETAPKVLELRKKGAFLGYTYRRFRYGRGSDARSGSQRSIAAGSTHSRKTVWHRARVSMH